MHYCFFFQITIFILNNKGIRTPRQERHTEIQDVKHFFKKGLHSPGSQDYTAQFCLISRLISSPRHERSKRTEDKIQKNLEAGNDALKP